jgi:hypothetical protein
MYEADYPEVNPATGSVGQPSHSSADLGSDELLGWDNPALDPEEATPLLSGLLSGYKARLLGEPFRLADVPPAVTVLGSNLWDAISADLDKETLEDRQEQQLNALLGAYAVRTVQGTTFDCTQAVMAQLESEWAADGTLPLPVREWSDTSQEDSQTLELPLLETLLGEFQASLVQQCQWQLSQEQIAALVQTAWHPEAASKQRVASKLPRFGGKLAILEDWATWLKRPASTHVAACLAGIMVSAGCFVSLRPDVTKVYNSTNYFNKGGAAASAQTVGHMPWDANYSPEQREQELPHPEALLPTEDDFPSDTYPSPEEYVKHDANRTYEPEDDSIFFELQRQSIDPYKRA